MTVELILGDCLDVLRGMEAGSVSIVTDPPYGIADVWKGGASSGWAVARLATAHRNSWDVKPDQDALYHIQRIGAPTVIWGGNYFNLPISRGWLVWNKPERGFTLAEAELAWTSKDFPIRVFDCHRSDPGREHPTQKPLSLMRWTLEIMRIPAGATIFDPYMGSGTTGVAAVQLGYSFLGCEIDPGYYAIAQARIAAAQLQPRLEMPDAGGVQLGMEDV